MNVSLQLQESLHWFRYQLREKTIGIISLIFADFVFQQISYTMSRLLYNQFQKPEELSFKEKVIRDGILGVTYLSTYFIFHVSFVNIATIQLSPMVMIAISLSVFILGTYFQKKF